MLHTCLKKFEEVIVKRKKKREFDIGVFCFFYVLGKISRDT